MALKGCPAVIKYLLFLFNLIFWLVGIAMIAFGVWVLVDKNIAEQLDDAKFVDVLRAASIIIISVGAVIMLTGFLGCCGAIRESQCCLVLFFVMLLVMFLIIAAAVVFPLVKQDLLKDELVIPQLRKGVETFKTKGESGGLLTFVETEFECCGVSGQTDYVTPTKECQAAMKKKSKWATKGCVDPMFDYFNEHTVIIVAVGAGVCVVLLLGMVFSCVLCCSIRQQSRYLTDEDY